MAPMTKAIILGCGPSGGVPQPGGGEKEQGVWGKCDPSNPKNSRRRCSLYIEEQGKRLLIDTGADLRWQLIDNSITDLDAVLYTHAHADHINGIDDLRSICLRRKKVLEIYSNQETIQHLQTAFSYLFNEPNAQNLYPRLLNPNIIRDGTFQAAGIGIEAFTVDHVVIQALGYKIGDIAYFPDIFDMAGSTKAALSGVHTLIIDCFQYREHKTHAHFDKTMQWIEEIQPKQAFLTNLGLDMDYKELSNHLKPNIYACYDGLEIIT